MAQYSGYVGFGGPQYTPQPGQFGYAAPAAPSSFQQQQFSSAPSSFNAAAPAAAASSFAAPVAQGVYGHNAANRVIAPASLQAQYRGKPAFYDAGRGIYFDGRTAFYDSPQGAFQSLQQQQAQSQQFAGQQFSGQQFAGVQQQQQFPASASQSVFTAIESPHIVLGNGTSGNLREHANALSSAYAFDYNPQYYL